MAQDMSLMSAEDRSKLREYQDRYNMSIKKVASFVDYRIFNAKLGIDTLNSALSSLAIVKTARPMHQRDESEIDVVNAAEENLRRFGIRVPAPEAEPEPEPGFGAIKKKTRRRRKSKGRNSTKGKKKKGKKRKQTKRGGKKK